ncbi:UNVERIFIED_CONTAM: hypothetical protein K2H54_073981 [Gekko kuhli]
MSRAYFARPSNYRHGTEEAVGYRFSHCLVERLFLASPRVSTKGPICLPLSIRESTTQRIPSMVLSPERPRPRDVRLHLCPQDHHWIQDCSSSVLKPYKCFS